MLKDLIILLFLILFLNLEGQSKLKVIEPIKHDSLPSATYKIDKIKHVKSVYVIYALKDNERYKIVSIREKSKNCNKIKVGHEYDLVLFPYFDEDDLSNSIVTHVEINGTSISLIDDCHANIYTSTNLKGLCYLGP